MVFSNLSDNSIDLVFGVLDLDLAVLLDYALGALHELTRCLLTPPKDRRLWKYAALGKEIEMIFKSNW